MKVLSIRQPWAWAIIYGGKNIENRTWEPSERSLAKGERFAIHAGLSLTRSEYYEARQYMQHLGVAHQYAPPSFRFLEQYRGGIIGTVEFDGVTHEPTSPWFTGPVGIKLKNPEPCEFIPCRGRLGFFEIDAVSKLKPVTVA